MNIPGFNFPGEPDNELIPSPEQTALNLGTRIRHARLRRNISAARLAKDAGMSLPTLRQVEKGSLSVSIGSIVRILFCLRMESDFEHVAADKRLAQFHSCFSLPKRAAAVARRRRQH
jgi:transcriptional regulator with XRE-family HTH domain